jgi:hypothetical protein
MRSYTVMTANLQTYSVEGAGYIDLTANGSYAYRIGAESEQTALTSVRLTIEDGQGIAYRLGTATMGSATHCVATPTPTAISMAAPITLTYSITTTEEIAEQFVAFGSEGAAEQPILLGFGGLVLGVFVMIFVRAIIGGRP